MKYSYLMMGIVHELSVNQRLKLVRITILTSIILFLVITIYGQVLMQPAVISKLHADVFFEGITTFAGTSSCTVLLYLNGQTQNSSITYGIESNYTAVFFASSTSSSAHAFTYGLYVNGLPVTIYTTLKGPNSTTTLNNITIRGAGNVNISANSTGGTTNCAVTRTQIINKTTPSMTLTANPGNFTYNGTLEYINGVITTINNQLTATMSVNGVNILYTNTSVYYLNATAGKYISWFNTSGNQNYTQSSHLLTTEISKALPDMALNASTRNFTYNGTNVIFTAITSSVNNQITNSKLYINSRYTVSPYSNATAGTYNAVYNTSGNINYSSETLGKTIVISKAMLAQNLTALPATIYQYNKTTPKIYVNISGPDLSKQTGLTIYLYNNTVYTGLSHNITSGRDYYNFSSLPVVYMNASNYLFYSRVSGNVNYTSSNSSVLNVNITDRYPTLNIQVLNSSYTNGEVLKRVLFNISSIDNQILGTIDLNGTNIGNTTTVFYYNITGYNRYNFEMYTLGNINYDPASKFLSLSLNSTKITRIPTPQPSPPPLGISPIKIQVPVTMRSGAMTNMYWLLYFYNDSFIRITTDLLPPSNFVYVPLPKNSFRITRITYASTSYVTVPTIELKRPNVVTCGSKALDGAFIFFNATDFLNDINSPIKNITYSFELNRSFIVGVNKTAEDVIMYRCNTKTMGWTALNTTEISENDTTMTFSSTTLGTSVYGIAFNISRNITNNVKILTIINVTGLPQGYTYKVKFYNKTRASTVPDPINFYTSTYGLYYLKAYNLSNMSIKNGSLCITTYTPNNLPAGFNTTVNAGSVFNIDYSNSTECIDFFKGFRSTYELYAITITFVVVITFLMGVIYVIKRNRLP